MFMPDSVIKMLIDNVLAKYGITPTDIDRLKLEAFECIQLARATINEVNERSARMEAALMNANAALAVLMSDKALSLGAAQHDTECAQVAIEHLAPFRDKDLREPERAGASIGGIPDDTGE